MRQPFALTFKIARYLMGKRMRGEDRFPVVMMLEPLHT
jgi:hypothetical protein